MFSIILSIEGGILNSLFWITKLLTCPYSTFYTHTFNKLTWGTSIRDLFTEHLTKWLS